MSTKLSVQAQLPLSALYNLSSMRELLMKSQSIRKREQAN